jgi:hypothetical protein
MKYIIELNYDMEAADATNISDPNWTAKYKRFLSYNLFKTYTVFSYIKRKAFDNFEDLFVFYKQNPALPQFHNHNHNDFSEEEKQIINNFWNQYKDLL